MKIAEYIKNHTETLSMLMWLAALFSCAHFLLSLDLEALEAGQGQAHSNLYRLLSAATLGSLIVSTAIKKTTESLLSDFNPILYISTTYWVALIYNDSSESNGLPVLATLISGAFTSFLFPLIAVIIIIRITYRIAYEGARTGTLSKPCVLNFAVKKAANSLALMVLAILFLIVVTPESVNNLSLEGSHDAVILISMIAVAFTGCGIIIYIMTSHLSEQAPHNSETLDAAKMAKPIQSKSVESN